MSVRAHTAFCARGDKMTETKTISVHVGTYERLVKEKKYDRETFDEVINHIIDGDKKPKGSKR